MNRATRRRGDPRRGEKRRLVLLAAGAVAILAMAGATVFALLSRSDGEGDVVDPGPEPTLTGPAVKFAASEEEIGGGIEAVPAESSALTPDFFADPSLGPFKDSIEGKSKAAEWGYTDGYIGSLQPDGLAAGVVLGRFYVHLETHLFQSPEGAGKAYAWYAERYNANDAVEKQESAPLGNESSAWKGVLGKVGSSELDQVFHRFIFRRGNLVAMVETIGADTFMTIEPARDISVAIDERALGNRAALTPTPGGGALPSVPTPVR